MERKVVINDETYEYISNISKKSEFETGFYLIGMFAENLDQYFVLDAIEYKYLERTRTSIVGDPVQKSLLYQSLPGGLKILGNIHSHPFVDEIESLKPSVTDLATYESYNKGIFGLIDREGRFVLLEFNHDLEKIKPIGFEIESRDTLYDFFEFYKIEEVWCIVPKLYSYWNKISFLHNSAIKRMNLIYMLSRITFEGDKPKLIKPLWIDVYKGNATFKIPYRIFYSSLESLKTKIGTLFGPNIIYNEKLAKSVQNKLEKLEIFIKINP